MNTSLSVFRTLGIDSLSTIIPYPEAVFAKPNLTHEETKDRYWYYRVHFLNYWNICLLSYGYIPRDPTTHDETIISIQKTFGFFHPTCVCNR